MPIRRLGEQIHCRAIKCAFALCLIGLIGRMPSVSAASRINATPPDSFLTTQVTTINELVYEINSNPKIRARYAKLFHLPPDNVATYFKRNLVISKLTSNYYGPVYSVRPGNGQIFVFKQRIKAGTKVFGLRDGRPVLKWACGNPLYTVLPKIKVATATNNKRNKGRVAQAPFSPNYGHHAGDHGQPIQETSNVYVPPTDIFQPTEQVLPYTATLPPVAGPTDFSVPFTNTFDFHIPLGFFAALPVGYLVTNHGTTPGGLAIPAPEASPYLTWSVGGVLGILALFVIRRKKTSTDGK